MKEIIFSTNKSWSAFMLRIFLGIVVLPHGIQKLFGWFGGYGFSGTMGFFVENAGLPWIVGVLVIVLEFFGAIALIAGIATRILAALYTILAMGITFSSHISNGFFMNWSGSQAGEGFEFFVLWIGMSIALLISGGGRYSFDEILMGKKSEGAAA